MASAPNFILFMCDSLPVACKWQCSGTPKRVVSECDGHGAQLIASSRAPPGLLSANAQPTKHGTSLNTPAWVQEHLLLYNGVGRRKNDGCRRKTKGGKKHRDVVEGLSQGDDGNDAAATTDAASLDATTKMFHGFFRLAASQRAERRNQQLYPFSVSLSISSP
ncbi:hypothetical protein ABL78_8293 [Leptomonas seymouri]|uniref:Uncharacterized protein n=1 Tax=Leptomonas seymouri TaxID=5684 RepID=A0A0N1P9Z3_LEPSE|nr:hypothetical protein ABL78_8293 [Leptomonas seymouri]|eukprot:KPI82693.1 hypothetical protein ABL78_8293 [Leptomonas seymouri]